MKETIATKDDRFFYTDREKSLTDSELKHPFENFKNVPYYLTEDQNLVFQVLGRKNCFEI